MLSLVLALPAIQLQAIKSLLDQAIDISLSRATFKAQTDECTSFDFNHNSNKSILCINPFPDLKEVP